MLQPRAVRLPHQLVRVRLTAGRAAIVEGPNPCDNSYDDDPWSCIAWAAEPRSFAQGGAAYVLPGARLALTDSLVTDCTASGATDPAADFARPFSAVLADIDLHRARSPRLSPTPPRRGSPLSRVAYRSPYRRSPTLSPPARTVFLPRGDHRALSPPAGIVPL